MEWQFLWGPQLRKLREIELDTGVTPKALEDIPKLYGVCVEVVQIYNSLASRRTTGISTNPIQISEIHAYLCRFGDPLLPLDILFDLISVMDLKYLELSNGNAAAGKR